jgi:hypothetical protein
MSASKKLDDLIQQVEHYVECWKQFNHYFGLARSKEFGQEDEDQFLEVKSVITQELEIIAATIQSGLPARDEVRALIAEVPSVRFMSELNDAGLKALEGKWHRLYMEWQAVLGQLKAQQRQLEAESGWSFFKRKKS